MSKGGSVSRRGQTEPPLDGSLQHNYQDDELVMMMVLLMMVVMVMMF